MDPIVQIRQMMAEEKFAEVQKLIEVQFNLNLEARHELLRLYYEVLKIQHKSFSEELALDLAEIEVKQKNFEFAQNLLSLVKNERSYIKVQTLKISIAQEKGRMEDLYTYVSDFLLRQFENQNPHLPEIIKSLIENFFKQDFHLQLKYLALTLLLNDISKAEDLTKKLIISCYEKNSPKGTASKLQSIGEILKSGQQKAQLEIYENFCFIAAHGLQEKNDYKRLVEMVIYFEEFRFMVVLLNLMTSLDLLDIAKDYAVSVRESTDYQFVYLDKYFPHLKSFFFKKEKIQEKANSDIETPDLNLVDKIKRDVVIPFSEIEENEDDQKFFHLLKHQEYSVGQLCDLAVSFLQSEMPKVALQASEMALKSSTSNEEILKASYLKFTCQLQLNDLRAAVDTCFNALTKASSLDDVLSFMYGQAEAYIRLGDRKNAKSVLSKLISIDANYRLAKERLDKLNEI